jgi:hypothetical protein
MNEEENTSVMGQVSEAVAQAAESQNAQEHEEQEAQRRKRTDVEYNWAEARRAMQERDRQIRELQEQVQKLSSHPVEDDDLSNLSKDDILNVEVAQKLIKKEAAKIAEQVIKQREAATVEERLQLKYSDYNDIVTKENIDLLKQTEPELALSLYRLQDDPYSQGVAVYKLLKKIGNNSSSSSPEKERALKNAQKPVSVNSVTKQSAIGNAHLFENGLTKELKSQLWKEMKEAMKLG